MQIQLGNSLKRHFFTKTVCKATKINKKGEFLLIAENCSIISHSPAERRRDLNFLFF